jgi:hypothetical protein
MKLAGQGQNPSVILKERHPRCVIQTNYKGMYTSNTTMSGMLIIY